jgi:hypothetical protein
VGGGLYSDELFEDLAREHAHVVRLERLETLSRQVCALRVLACSSSALLDLLAARLRKA